MPTYGDKKIKDMVRSVLPSTKRRYARWAKAQENQAGRTRAREALDELQDDPEGDADFQDRLTRHRIRGVVNERRTGDKTRPLQQWAPKITKGRPDKRLAQIGRILPKNTIGRHAISHLEYLPEFKINPLNMRSRRWDPPPPTPEQQRARFVKENRPGLVRRVIETEDLHRLMNDFLKRRHRTTFDEKKNVQVGPRRPRLLLGLGDVDTFLQDLKSAAGFGVWSQNKYIARTGEGTYHPEWEGALDDFLGICVKHDFDAGDVRNEAMRHMCLLFPGTL